MTFSRQIAEQVTCECSDPGCPAHKGVSHCATQATDLLYRVDMQDETGTAMCDKCADDAFSSGLFTTEDGLDETDYQEPAEE